MQSCFLANHNRNLRINCHYQMQSCLFIKQAAADITGQLQVRPMLYTIVYDMISILMSSYLTVFHKIFPTSNIKKNGLCKDRWWCFWCEDFSCGLLENTIAFDNDNSVVYVKTELTTYYRLFPTTIASPPHRPQYGHVTIHLYRHRFSRRKICNHHTTIFINKLALGQRCIV